MKNNKLFFWIAIVLQIVILVIIIIRYSSVLIGWTEILIKARPVDPLDLFRGEYVTLAYSIDSFEHNLGSGVYTMGETVYILPEFGKDWKIVDSIKNVLKEPPSDWLYFQAKIKQISKKVDYVLSYMSWWVEYTGSYSNFVYLDDGIGDVWDDISVYMNWDWTISYFYKKTDNGDLAMDQAYLKSWKILKKSMVFDSISLDYWVDRFFVKEWTAKDIEKGIREDSVYVIWKVKSGRIVVDALMVNWVRVD